jgi:hypothetical protein
MRIRRSITPWLSALAFALCATAPAFVTAQSRGNVFVNESGEDAAPMVTSTAPFFIDATVIPNGPETWLIDVKMAGDFINFGDPPGVELIEPGTGNHSDSFGIVAVNPGDGGNPTTTFVYQLFSDDEAGNLSNRVAFCLINPAVCPKLVEDGTFQPGPAGAATTAGTFDVFLKSDLADPAPIPEPTTLAVFILSALGLAMLRRCGKSRGPSGKRGCRGQ